MAITYFNYNEIYLRARKDPAAIIILTYGQTNLYNILSTKQLMSKLNINHIPSYLFTRGYLKQSNGRLWCMYKTIEPQSYFRNPNFLFSMASARHKALYIRALSTKKIANQDNKIPRYYFNKVAYNPFLIVTDDYIEFKQESS